MIRTRPVIFKTILTAAFMVSVPAFVSAAGDAAKGEKVFRKCKACHAVGEGAENRVGPMLNGIVGRAVASVNGFKYSAALEALNADAATWTPEELDAFLTKPRDYAKGTKMTFAGLRKEEDRTNIIAYLATFADEGT
ncbi:MAG: cytochrome c family protein [Paracoccaceae bacterium]